MSPPKKPAKKEDLEKIGQRVRSGKVPQETSPITGLELNVYEREKLKIKIARLRLENRELKHIIELRRPFAWMFTWLSIGWLIVVLWIVYQTGSGKLILPSDVLQWLIAGVAVDLIGLLYIIARFLFPDPKEKP